MERILNKEMENTIKELGEKYFDLVWYSRTLLYIKRDSERLEVEGVMEKMEDIKAKYPTETFEIDFEPVSDWTNGFNSGALAVLRYVMCLSEGDKELADELFPMLDT